MPPSSANLLVSQCEPSRTAPRTFPQPESLLPVSSQESRSMSQSTLLRPDTNLTDDDVSAIDELGNVYRRLCAELGRVIVGQRDVIEQLAICLFARGHGLLMGVPGLAKTLLVSKLAET